MLGRPGYYSKIFIEDVKRIEGEVKEGEVINQESVILRKEVVKYYG